MRDQLSSTIQCCNSYFQTPSVHNAESDDDAKKCQPQCRAGNEESQRDQRVSCTRKNVHKTKEVSAGTLQNLKILIELEVSTVLVGVHDLFAVILLLVGASHDTGLLVVADTLLEEIGFAGQ